MVDSLGTAQIRGSAGWAIVARIACVACLTALLPLCVACKSESQDAAPATSAPVLGPTWEAPRRYTYTLELSSRLGIKSDDMLALELRSDVVLESRRDQAGKLQFAFHLPNASFRTEDEKAKAQFEGLTEELRKPFAFSLERGRLHDLRVPQGWSQFATSIARTVAAAFQFVDEPTAKAEANSTSAPASAKTAPSALPVANNGEAWTAEELDATGTYRVEYRRSGVAHQLAKKKLEYRELALGTLPMTQLAAKLTPKVLVSSGSVVLSSSAAAVAGADGGGSRAVQLARVEYEEKLETPLTATAPMISKTSLKLVLQGSEPPTAGVDWPSLLANSNRLAPTDRYVAPANGHDFDATRIGQYTFATALMELEQQSRQFDANQLTGKTHDLSADPTTRDQRESQLSDRSRVFGAMAALLRKDAKNVAAASQRVKQGSPAKRALLDALASAGSPEAQAELVKLMADPGLDKTIRLGAAFSLGRIERAAPESVAALSKYTSDSLLHVHALYGLGTIARRLRESGATERAEAIVQTLIAALRASSSPAARVHALRGLANAGSASAFDAAKPFLDDRSAKVRAASIDALRLMKHPDVDGLIAQRLAKDDSVVQASALEAIAVREPSDLLVGALEFAATRAQKPEARLRAVRIIERWLPQRPGLRATLERVATNDEREPVRRAAKAALDS